MSQAEIETKLTSAWKVYSILRLVEQAIYTVQC